MVIPNRLKQGDTIGVVSPSEPITRERRSQLDRGMKFLRGLGFKVRVGRNILKIDDYSAGSPRLRAEDINSMFADNAIDGIICSQGGDTANACLPLLDWETIRHHPKVFPGISDITTLLNPIHAKTGLVTFHGNDLVFGFGLRPSKYDKQEFLDRLMLGKIGEVRKNGGRRTVRKGLAIGKLWGGNIGSLRNLAGTSYFPDLKRGILFIEAYTPTPAVCDALFNQFKQMGFFEKIGGVIVGYIHSLQVRRRKITQMEDILLKVTEGYDFPILKTNDFGHECPNTVIPIGVEASLDADKKEIKIQEPCVA